ncbi:MAG: hypothetical protein ABSB59_43505 [Streptosporangiaceae bacterium]
MALSDSTSIPRTRSGTLRSRGGRMIARLDQAAGRVHTDIIALAACRS